LQYFDWQSDSGRYAKYNIFFKNQMFCVKLKFQQNPLTKTLFLTGILAGFFGGFFFLVLKIKV